MKVLLLNPPADQLVIRDNFCCFTSKSNYLWPPIDLLALSGLLYKEHDLLAIDAVASQQSPSDTLQQILNFNPDTIISLTGTATFSQDSFFFKNLRKRWKKDLILCGNIAAFEPEKVFKVLPWIKATLHNFTSPEIIDFLRGEKKEYQNISYRPKTKVRYGQVNYPLGHKTPLTYGIPQHQLFPIQAYKTPFMRQSPLTTVMISYGCPFSCKFCIASMVRFQPRSLTEIEAEFDHIHSLGIKELFFQDSTFNAQKEFTIAVCKLMVEKKYGFSWSANVHSACLDHDRIVWMKKAGCHTMNIGVENASETILKHHFKGTNPSKIKEAFKLCRKIGVNTMGYFIIGLPEDTEESIRKTIDFALQLNPSFASFSIATADYGTRLWDEVKTKKLLIPMEDFDSSSLSNFKHPTISNHDLRKFFNAAYRRFYFRPSKVIELGLLSLRNGTIKKNTLGGLKLLNKMVLNH